MTTVSGIVTNGVVRPNSPLPEGAIVEIHLRTGPPNVPADLQEELDGWERAGTGTIEMVGRLAETMDSHENR